MSYGGSRVFYLYKSIGLEQHRIRIGAFPYLTIDKARKKAFELKAQIAIFEADLRVKALMEGKTASQVFRESKKISKDYRKNLKL